MPGAAATPLCLSRKQRLPLFACLCALLAALALPSHADSPPEFDIPPQQLTTALLEFARQARVSIGFPDELTDGLVSAGVRGTMSRSDALRTLLGDSGLGFTQFGRDVYRIRRVVNRSSGNSTSAAPAASRLPRTASRRLPANQPVEEIITVGSQIRNARVVGMLPVSVIDDAYIDAAGASSAGDLLRTLAAAGVTHFNGIDNYFYGVNDARGDVSSLNLRELGSGNTLMLLNGRRMVLHPGVQAEGRVLATTVNSNILPAGGIARVEILRDGASSLYGSEAVGGVVNTVVRHDVDGIRLDIQRGSLTDSALDETAVNVHLGGELGERGRISLLASFLQRDALPATDRHYAESSDLRPLFAGTHFAGDADLRNTAAASAWGQFNVGQPVSRGGELLTTDSGLFHLQPASFAGCRAMLTPSLCIDDDTIDDALRFNNNAYRDLAPELQRSNVFAMLSHALGTRDEIYGEVGWYDARSENRREPANPLSSHPITIPADNYWNPFGPVNFADGRPNPNRLPGIDAPAEGLPILINTRVFGSFYRVVDAGPRRIVVDNDSLRLLAGVRGERGNFSYDSALLYSDARTVDTTYNRISSTLFQQALARDDASAYNPFNGGDPARPSSGDATPNPQDVIDYFLIDVERHNKTSLALADFHLSNPTIADLPAGPVGLALGAEVRRERFAENRDPRLDGTITYTDSETGVRYESDVMQSSATPDSAGSRTAYSLFAEVALPLVGESMRIPLVQRLDAQLALRYERFSDVGDELKPRAALSWQLRPGLQLRASWAQGFSAPNLPQINAGAVPRIQVVRDWYRCQALINKGLAESFGACVLEDVRAVEVVTSGSAALTPENSSNLSFGAVLHPLGDRRLTITADYWRIAQNGVVGLFGEQNHVALDYILRLQGGNNPAVVRAPLRQEDIDLFNGSGLEPVGLLSQVADTYLNLDRRVTRGIDIAALYSLQTTTRGRFLFSLEATRLLEAEQEVPPLGGPIVNLNEPAIALIGAGNLLERDGKPRWRATATVDWQRGRFGAGLLTHYVGAIDDTSAIQDQGEELLRVAAWSSSNAYAEYRWPLAGLEELRLRFGMRNVFNSDPPLADEALGHFVGLHNSLGRYSYLSVGATF
jgi:iron complex outermembrane recepter protein